MVLALVATATASRADGGAHGNRAAARARRTAHGASRSAPPPPSAPLVHPDSVGHPNDGHLEGGVHLDTSKPYLRVVPAYAAGDVRWGLPALVSLVDRAGRAVDKRFPGSKLEVGDISRRGGGEVLRHHSHESGRDVDLGFYVADAKGKQVHGHGFIRVDEDGRTLDIPGAHFDVARNWLLVQTLLLDSRARVSHVFVAEPQRQALLAHARRIGVAPALRARAAIVLMQPTESLPHDDHMHVRISCPNDARDRCIELAKDAPMGAKRHVVARRHDHGRPAVVTPEQRVGHAMTAARGGSKGAAAASRRASSVARPSPARSRRVDAEIAGDVGLLDVTD